MFDEPSLGLSPALVLQVVDIVKRLNAEGLTCVLVEQNVVQSLDLAGRAYVLENGAVAMSGPAEALRRDPTLMTTYLGL